MLSGQSFFGGGRRGSYYAHPRAAAGHSAAVPQTSLLAHHARPAEAAENVIVSNSEA